MYMYFDMNDVQLLFLGLLFQLANSQQTMAVPSRNLTDVLPYDKQWTSLEKKILKDYVRTVRPVKNDSTRTVVSVLAAVNHIEEINEEEQTMRVHGYLMMDWKDEFLVWDVNEFSGLTKITIHPGYIWKPDIMLYNTASGEEMGRSIGGYQEQVWIYNDGRVIYFPRFSMKATCLFDYSDYPYDVQECPLILGSWSYTLRDLDIVPAAANVVLLNLSFNDTKNIVTNWEVVNTRSSVQYWDAFNKERTDLKPPETSHGFVFPEYYIWVKLRRYAPYFGAVVLLPTLMTSLFTMAAFWTRSYTAGILMLMVNIMVQAVFTDDLIEKVPPSNGAVPKIVRYFAINLSLTVVSVVTLTILQSISEIKSQHNVPSVLRFFVYGRRFLTERLNDRLTFVRQIDEEEDENESGNVENQPTSHGMESSKVVVSWTEVGKTFNSIIFMIVFLCYILSMFLFLC